MGSKVEGAHTCTAIDNLDQLKRAVNFQKVVSEICFSMSRIKIDESDFEELNPRLVGMQSWDKVSKLAKDGDWSKTDESLMKKLVEGLVFCRNADSGIINAVPKALYSMVSAKCAALFVDKAKVKMEIWNSMPPAAFGLFTGMMASQIDVTQLTDDRFASLGSDLEDQTQTYAATLTKEALSKMKPSRTALLSPKFWKSVPAAAYSGLSSAQLQAIPAANLVEWTLAQVKSIPLSVLKTISPDQLGKIGINHKDSKNPIAAFKDIKDDLSPEARVVYRARGDAPMVVASLMATFIVVLFSVTVLLW
jgi:hypothetical protein